MSNWQDIYLTCKRSFLYAQVTSMCNMWLTFGQVSNLPINYKYI